MQDIRTIVSKTARLGWVIAAFCPLAAWAAMADDIQQLDPRVKIIADHYGGAFPGDEDTEDFKAFLSLVLQKRLVVKISGFERLYNGHDDGMNALERITKAIVKAGPDQIIYGSDWPHTQLGVSRQGKTDEQRLTDVEGFRNVPNTHHIQTLRAWIPDDGVWQKLFVTNAEALFQ
jgi:predicted TIM-barrel fold metal-dependent hydrolase